MSDRTRISELNKLISERVLVVDGAMGTAIQDLNLSDADFGGPEFEGCNEYLNLVKPEVVKSIHRKYALAGADIIETNSFGSTPIVLAEYGLGDKAYEISKMASFLARQVAGEFESDNRLVFVAGSMGPTTKSLSLTGGITWDELSDHYYTQARGLIHGGADLLLLETSQDILNVKAGLNGIDKLSEELGFQVPTAIQCTIENMGTMLCGQDIEAFYISIAHRDLLWIGMNCATGPEFMRDHIRTLSGLSKFPIAVIPNAGLPDEDGHYHLDPENLSDTLGEFGHQGWLNIVGGCCGTNEVHISQIVRMASELNPRIPVVSSSTVVSGLDPFVIEEDNRPVLVGERTNVLGSRAFKRLVAESKWEEMSEIGRAQVRGGAQVLDVCLQDPDRDEVSDVVKFLEYLTKKIKVPIMLDSTDSRVIEEALKYTPGKSIINSINLEDGEDRFISVVPLVRKFGAAVIVGCIDEDKEQAQAITRQRKVQIAERSYNILTQNYDINPEDIIFDGLVFPIGTGDENYIKAGVETIEGIRLIKESMPKAKTILGISNVSFGLPQSGREVLNSVFLYHCVQAGLDMAIVNPQMLQRYASIPKEEKDLAENLIWWLGDDPIGQFANHFRDKKVEVRTEEERKGMPLDDRLSMAVIEGTKDGLIADLDEALKDRGPLEIINGPLMDGMDEVGRLFGNNELIVAEVLGSAESMKAAVNYLENYMDKEESATRGIVVLATVKGDVHDIGKNLVDIILSNNGYRIINLGIKVQPQELISAVREFNPNIIGLSGLLVKSAQMMVETARDLSNAGIDTPILVGGAALSNRFTRLRIAKEYEGIVAYARDAMGGLDLANRIIKPEMAETLRSSLIEETAQMVANESTVSSGVTPSTPVSKKVRLSQVSTPPTPPDLKLHTILDYDFQEIFDYINPVMLYVRHLGYRGRFEEDLLKGEARAVELRDRVRKIEDIMLKADDIKARAVYKFFRANASGDKLRLYADSGNKVIEEFHFGRQSGREGLCLADYILDVSSNKTDYLSCFVTSVGPGVRNLASDWINQGKYLDAHILQAIALESAESLAEILHRNIRSMWGIGDTRGISKQDIFKANYHGKRYSFGYPACPRLEDQEQLWRLLQPYENIGVELTEEFMMDPEASVSAIVMHHSEAKYFNLDPNDIEELESRL
ncbi:MAG: methionine synthase [Dehalococcoidia bacterium]|nr:methionine synthase [Dehalococcoidia bacterium]